MLARSIARRFDLEFVAIALPRAGDWDVFEAGAATIALDTRRALHGLRRRPDLARVRRVRADLCRSPDDGGRRSHGSARPAAGRDQADRPARRGRPADRAGHARHARRRGRDRDRARAVSRGTEGGRADPPERGVEDGAAGIARPRSAHAAHGHSRRGQQHQGIVADRGRPAGADGPDSVGSRAPDAAVPEHPRDGAHRRRRDRRRSALGAPLGDRRRGTRPGRADAAAAHTGRERRCRTCRCASTRG